MADGDKRRRKPAASRESKMEKAMRRAYPRKDERELYGSAFCEGWVQGENNGIERAFAVALDALRAARRRCTEGESDA